MKRLGTVEICGIDYTVEEHTLDEDDRLSDCYGYCVHLQSLIVVRAGLVPTAFRNVLLHEVQHGIWEHSGIKQLEGGDKYEESFVSIFTPHWIAAVQSMKKWRLK